MIDWTLPDWSYLLGVVHGDGSIAPRSVCISVGHKDGDYASLLSELWERFGCRPKLYRGRSGLRLDVHDKPLRDAFAAYKERGIWQWPAGLHAPSYLAGVFDTDGCVPAPSSKRLVIVL